MQRSALANVALVLLFLMSLICRVWADGYEVETVGGVVSPTNLVTSLTQAVILTAAIIGFIMITAYVRIGKTN